MLRPQPARSGIAAALIVLAFSAVGVAQQAPHQFWVTTWGASQQIPEPQNTLLADYLRDSTLRQIVHVSMGGSELRVHLSNVMGIVALHFTSVHIAKPLAPDGSAIDPATDHALTFSGALDVTIPPGAEYISDPIAYALKPLSDVAISFHLDDPPVPETGHPGSRSTSYYVHGDEVSMPVLDGAGKVDHWYQIASIDVQASPGAASVVALGDSITDGHATTTNGNDRWTDVLAQRLQQSPRTQDIGVSNQGIGGNHLLTDGLGPDALARLDRDVLAPAGVRWVVVFEGVNDLGALSRRGDVAPSEHAALVARIEAAYEQIVSRAHAHGIRVIGATITPYSGSGYYHPGSAQEADREAVNAWIRTPGHFDDVIDFDRVVSDPEHPDRLLPAYDCGDHLHPSPAGYRAMGTAIPLSLFER
ncbi:MAG: SGNH/GDSL hydrolase family protein [Terracidiphilus sp.]|nr:SGNH/GDSL hydrolase family protein [Terracidiphilus sp.]